MTREKIFLNPPNFFLDWELKKTGFFRLTGRAVSGRAEPIPLSGPEGVFSVIGIEDSKQGIPDPMPGLCDHSPAPDSSMLGP